MSDRNDPECDCKGVCEMVHFFSTMKNEPFDDNNAEMRHEYWLDTSDPSKPPSGILANYLLDPMDIFTERIVKNLSKLANNIQDDVELAHKRFDEVRINNLILMKKINFDLLGHCNLEFLL